MTHKDKEIDLQKLQLIEAKRLEEKNKIPDSLVAEHMSIIEAIASSICAKTTLPTGIEFEDLISWGVEGLIKAHKNFNAEKGSKFSTYAYYRVRGEMYDSIRKEWQYRNPNSYVEYRKSIQNKLADILETSLESPPQEGTPPEENVQQLMSSSALSCLISYENFNDIEHLTTNTASTQTVPPEDDHPLWDAVKDLTEEEQQIVDLFYVKGLKQVEIAKKLNYSNSKICRIHIKILEKLKSSLQKKEAHP